MHKIFWIGTRESDINNEKLFFGSITRYGTNLNNNIAFCNNNYTDSYDNFLEKSLAHVLNTIPDCKFIFSNSSNAYKFGKKVYDNTLCLNKLTVLESLNNKIFFRQLISDIVKVPPSIVVNTYDDIDFKFIRSIFNNNYNSFVVQSANSGGGEETFLLTEDTSKEVLNSYIQQVLITPYFQGAIPINIHIVLSNEDFRIFPPSVQIISNLFHYTGSDFIKYREFSKKIRDQLFLQCTFIAKKLQSLGARGLFGLDVLMHNDELYFIECNFRYQGSSFLLNEALRDYNLSSVFMTHYQSFMDNFYQLPYNTYDLDINYSSFRRTLNNMNIELPDPIQIKIDGDVDKPLRNGYLQYEVYKESIFEFLK